MVKLNYMTVELENHLIIELMLVLCIWLNYIIWLMINYMQELLDLIHLLLNNL